MTKDPRDPQSFSHTITVYFKISPHFHISSISNVGNNQSGSVTVAIDDATYNPYSPWTTVNYSTTHNLQVNGGSSYTSNNPGGGTNTDTQTLTTTNHGGRLYISVSNACATSATKDFAIGTPYLVSTTINGSPGSQATVSYVASLALLTDGTATNANWSVTNGSGSISPYGTSCNAYPSNFLRVVGAPTNAFGTGEEATFYIFKQGYQPYQAAYPNPTRSAFTINFEDAQMAQELVNSISLYNQKGKAVKTFDSSQLSKTFQKTGSVLVDVENLPADTYFLHVLMGGKLYESQIIVQ